MGTFFHVLLARIRGYFEDHHLDRELREEIAAHLAMAEEDLIRSGLTPKEARRRARVEFGGVTQLREAAREARGLPWLDSFWLDIKLSLRMLRKSWGLTLVGGLAMTLAITIGLVIFWFVELSFWPTLPLEEGDRVVAIQTWDDKAREVRETLPQDVERWREDLRSLEDIGTFRTIRRNLVIEGGPAAPVTVAAMSSSGFRLARISPILGRPLTTDDERAGAPPVLVLGHDIWRSRFGADPSVLGNTVRLGDTVHTVVGVMPPDFSFPVKHKLWIPLRIEPTDAPFEAEESVVFARLVDGVTLERARGELASLGLLPSPEKVHTEDELLPRLSPYALAFANDVENGEARWILKLVLFLIVLLLVPPCANIAILVYARTITRQEEFAARFTLGASRGRLVAQLFLEVLVLASAAAGAAFLLASLGGIYLRNLVTRKDSDGIPFWIDFAPTFRMVLVAAGLALVAAAIAGLVPALKATGRRMQSGLSSLGNGVSPRLGATWTALVILQVGLTVAALPSAIEMGWGTVREGILDHGFAAEQYFTAQVAMAPAEPLHSVEAAYGEEDEKFAARLAQLTETLQAEPGISGITAMRAVPGGEPWAAVEVEGIPLSKGGFLNLREVVRFNHVDDQFFEVFEFPILTGRVLEAGDFDAGRTPLVITQKFATELLGEGINPLGHRVRYSYVLGGGEPTEAEAKALAETWYEIVGVVADRPAYSSYGTMYHPMPPQGLHPSVLALRSTRDPLLLADRLRDITIALDPDLRLEDMLTLAAIYRDQQIGNNMGAFALILVTLSVLLLSAAGMYALMSFTVNQRRREIGIRAALGARPHRLVANILERALRQVGIGAALGAAVALLLDLYLPVEELGGSNVPAVIPGAVLALLLIGLLAALGPTRRGLQVDPIEVLREE